MKKLLTALVLSLVALATPGVADQHEAEATMERPSLSASRSEVMHAAVEAINHETRMITLRPDDGGEAVSFRVSEEARNLAQVEVGDDVRIEVIEEIDIEVVPGDGSMEPGRGAAAVAGRAEEGDMPGMAAMGTSVESFEIVGKNREAGTVALKDADGEVFDFTPRIPENIDRVEVGDFVVVMATESFAVSVTRPE